MTGFWDPVAQFWRDAERYVESRPWERRGQQQQRTPNAQPRQALTPQERERRARDEANLRAAERHARTQWLSVGPGGQIAGYAAQPFVNTIADPDRRAAALRGAQGAVRSVRDAASDLGAYVASGRAGEDFAALRATAPARLRQFGRQAQASAGRLTRAAEHEARAFADRHRGQDAPTAIASEIVERAPQIARAATRFARDASVGPWLDESRHQWELDYRRALGDSEGARQAANAANVDTAFATLNLSSFIPGGGVAARTGGRALLRQGIGEAAERTLRGRAQPTLRQGSTQAVRQSPSRQSFGQARQAIQRDTSRAADPYAPLAPPPRHRREPAIERTTAPAPDSYPALPGGPNRVARRSLPRELLREAAIEAGSAAGGAALGYALTPQDAEASDGSEGGPIVGGILGGVAAERLLRGKRRGRGRPGAASDSVDPITDENASAAPRFEGRRAFFEQHRGAKVAREATADNPGWDTTIGSAPKLGLNSRGAPTVTNIHGQTRTLPRPRKYDSVEHHADGSATYRREGVSLRYDARGFPEFASNADVYLDPAHVNSGDKEAHFRAANQTLAEALRRDGNLAERMGLSDDAVKFLMEHPASPEPPPGYSWDHHHDVGRMQLVDENAHKKFRHYGGMWNWGGGHRRGRTRTRER